MVFVVGTFYVNEFTFVRHVEFSSTSAKFGIYKVGRKCQSDLLVNVTAASTNTYEPLYFGSTPHRSRRVVVVCEQGQCPN